MTILLRGVGNPEAASRPPTGRAAHTEGSGTAATGTYCHSEGTGCTASGNNGSHSEGSSTTASGASSHAEGSGSTASGAYSHVEGINSSASGTYSHAQGYYGVAHRGGQHSQGNGIFAAAGDLQLLALVFANVSSNATPLELTAGANAVSAVATDASVFTVPASRGFRFRIEAVARNIATGAGEFAGWTITGTIVRGSTGDARLLGTPSVVTDSDAGASTWTLAVSVNTTDATYNYLAITATGEAAKTIRWVAAIYATEVG